MTSPMEQALTPFRLAIVGGGPAGTSVLIRAARIGVLSELLSKGGDGNDETAGLLLIDAGPPEALGAGALGSYGINSNTFIKKFADNVLRDRSEQIPPEAGSKTILEPLRRSQATRDVESFSKRIGPLHVVGRFLTQVGRVLKEEIDRHPESTCLCYHVVMALYQELDGHWTIHLRPSGKRRKELPFKNDKRFATLEDGMLVARAKKVVLASGGTQKLPESLPPPMVGWEQKVLLSDAVLKSTVHLMQRIRGSMVRRNGKTARVVIVGASHSGFSAAWLCLHRTDAALFDTKAITILQRGHIKVFYNSKEDAVKAGYCDYDDGNFNKKGQVFPYTGIRGDAKALYEAMVSGREKRVALLKLSEASACEEAVRDCDVIIWACGYIPQLPAIFGQPRGTEDKRLKLDVCVPSHGQACVNDEAEVCIPDAQGGEGPPVGNLLAVGLGYGFHSPYDGPGARADGVAVYLKRAACIILGAVLGPRALGGYESYEEREAELWRRDAQRREEREKRDASEGPIASPEATLSVMRSSRAAGAGEAKSQWKATMRLSQPRRQSEGTVRQAGRLPELAMTTGRMGLNLAELADNTAEPTMRPLALTHSTAWRLALTQPRTARSFRPALTSPLRRLSTPLVSVRQPHPAPRPFCTDTGSMLKPRPPWGSGGGSTGRGKHEVKNAA